jgi:hypothetical protein
MHHKRGRPKNRRAGCLLCKPHKMNGWGHFNSDFSNSNLKKEFAAKEDLKTVSQE